MVSEPICVILVDVSLSAGVMPALLVTASSIFSALVCCLIIWFAKAFTLAFLECFFASLACSISPLCAAAVMPAICASLKAAEEAAAIPASAMEPIAPMPASAASIAIDPALDEALFAESAAVVAHVFIPLCAVPIAAMPASDMEFMTDCMLPEALFMEPDIPPSPIDMPDMPPSEDIVMPPSALMSAPDMLEEEEVCEQPMAMATSAVHPSEIFIMRPEERI